METYYTKKEYNDMKGALTRKLKEAEKKIKNLENKLAEAKEEIDSLETDLAMAQNPDKHVTEEPDSNED